MPNIFVSPSKTEAKTKSSKQSFSLSPKSLSAFLFMPEDVRVETQEAGETIILLLRRHWITNLSWISVSFILLVTPLFIFPLLGFIGSLPQDYSQLVTFSILVWYLISLSYMIVNFLLWYFSVSVVTNERIIDIDFINILNKKFAETRISKVEDVTMKTGGFIRAIFDYGDVFVQTAAKEAMFQFNAVPHPERVVRTINELMDKIEEEGVP
jgi:hypothetical protein